MSARRGARPTRRWRPLIGRPRSTREVELLAISAYMLGREQDFQGLLGRSYRLHLEAEERPAVRCAFWIGVTLALRGERGRAGGWLGRARAVARPRGTDCVERGYLLILRVVEYRTDGPGPCGGDGRRGGYLVGERFGDPDLVSVGAFLEGRALIGRGWSARASAARPGDGGGPRG